MEISLVGQHWIRLSVFLMLVAFMVAGPFYVQIFGGKSRIVRAWTMFHTIGAGTIDARFTHLLADGTEVVLDRHELLRGKYEKAKIKPRAFWLISDWPQRDSEILVAKRLCEVVGSGRIRIDSRIARRSGWVPKLKGRIVDCAGKGIVEVINK